MNVVKPELSLRNKTGGGRVESVSRRGGRYSKSWTKAQPDKLHCVYNKVWDGWTDVGMSKLMLVKLSRSDSQKP